MNLNNAYEAEYSVCSFSTSEISRNRWGSQEVRDCASRIINSRSAGLPLAQIPSLFTNLEIKIEHEEADLFSNSISMLSSDLDFPPVNAISEELYYDQEIGRAHV